MDKDLKKDVEQLAQAKRLEEEEALHGENIAQGIELQEEVEEKERYLSKLRKQIKVWRGIFLAGLFALICILLYACAQAKLTETTMEVKQEPVVSLPQITPTPEPIIPKKETYIKDMYFVLEKPEISSNNLLSTTHQELLALESSTEQFSVIVSLDDSGIVDDIVAGERVYSYAEGSNPLICIDSLWDAIESCTLDYSYTEEVPARYCDCLEKEEITSITTESLDAVGDSRSSWAVQTYRGVAGSPEARESTVDYYNRYLLENYVSSHCCTDYHSSRSHSFVIYSDEALDEDLLQEMVLEGIEDGNYSCYHLKRGTGTAEVHRGQSFGVSKERWSEFFNGDIASELCTTVKNIYPDITYSIGSTAKKEGMYNYIITVQNRAWDTALCAYEQGLY